MPISTIFKIPLIALKLRFQIHEAYYIQYLSTICTCNSFNAFFKQFACIKYLFKNQNYCIPLVLVTKIHRPKNKTVHSKFTNNLLSKWPSSGQTISSLGCLLTILTLQAVESVFPLNHFTIWLHAWHTHTHTSQSVTEIIKNKFVHQYSASFSFFKFLVEDTPPHCRGRLVVRAPHHS